MSEWKPPPPEKRGKGRSGAKISTSMMQQAAGISRRSKQQDYLPTASVPPPPFWIVHFRFHPEAKNEFKKEAAYPPFLKDQGRKKNHQTYPPI
jgi:hypothetical protein